jgi:glycosyltransferase involved in cell wall biosynthesis
VSFDRFLRYAGAVRGLQITHVDLPVRKRDAEGRPGRVAPIRTALRGLAALVRIPFQQRVVLFSSRGLAFSYGLLLILASATFRKPVAVRLFGGRPYLTVARRSGLARRASDWVLSLASSISLETEVGRQDFPEALRTKVAAIPGYRSRRVEATKPYDGRRGQVRFVYAGRVDSTKGIDVLLDACNALGERLPERDFRVDCYGEPSDRLARDADGHRYVNLMGVVPNEEFLGKLPSYDAFVYPSVYDNEGHPGAVIEAMLAGLPVVCTALPTVMEIVSDGTEGLTTEPGDAASLAGAMERLITDRDLVDRLAEGATRKSRMFDEAVVIPRLLDEMGLRGEEQ